MERHPWPEAVDGLIGRLDGPIEQRGPDRWSVGSFGVVRLAAGPADASAHGRFLARLAEVAPFAVPEVVGIDGCWLVVERAAVGVPADRPDRHPEPGSLAGLIGAGLAALHAMPTSLLQSEAGPESGADGTGSNAADVWQPVVERCRRAVSAGHIASADLPEPYDRYQPEQLLEMLVEGIDGAADPADDSAVLSHGRPTADRFLVDGDRFVGFEGLETALVTDRHLDLATAHVSVADILGAEAVYGFYEAYGRDPDLVRLDRGVLALHLLNAAAGGR